MAASPSARRMRTIVGAGVATSALLATFAAQPVAAQLAGSRAPLTQSGATAGLDEEAGLVPELATETSNTYRQSDGSMKLEAFTEPVNFQAEDDSWVPIDNELVAAPGAAYEAENAANSFEVKIPSDPAVTPVRFTTEDAWVTMRMHGLDDAPQIEGEEATFSEVEDADEVTYQVNNTGLKEDIVLDGPPTEGEGSLVYTYSLDASSGITPVLTDSGSIEFRRADGETEVVMPAGFMTDSASPSPGLSHDVAYELEPQGAGWALTVTPSMGWLTDPARVYPVTIDPSLADKVVGRNCWLRSSTPNESNCYTPLMRAGRNVDGVATRTVLLFDLSAVPATADVYGANVGITQSSMPGMINADYALYKALKSFDNTATWNSAGATGGWDGGSPAEATPYGRILLSPNSTSRRYFADNFKTLIQDWVTNPGHRTSLVLKQATPVVNNSVVYFHSNRSTASSANHPALSVYYTVPAPPAPPVTGPPVLQAGDGTVHTVTNLGATPVTAATNLVVGPNATVDVPLAGIGSLPSADDLAAVWSNVRVANWGGTAGGVSVYNSDDDSPPAIAGLPFTATDSAADGVAKNLFSAVSEGGGVRILNHSSSPVTVTLTVQAWYATAGNTVPTATLPAPMDSPLKAEGQLLLNGAPVTNGEVHVEAWPNDTVLDQLPEDGEVEMLDLGTVTTDSTGSFELPLAGAEVPPAYRDSEARANISLEASSASLTMEYSQTLDPLTGGQQGTQAMSVTSDAGPDALVLDLGAGTVDEASDPASEWRTVDDEPLSTPEQTAAKTVTVRPRSPSTPGALQRGGGCRIAKKELGPGKPERFVSVYNWSGAKADLTQETSSEHEMGIAFKAEKGAVYTADGTKKVKTSSKGEALGIVNKTFSNNVRYRKYVRGCNWLEPSEYAVWYKPEIIGAYFTNPEPIQAKNWRHNCIDYDFKFKFTKHKGSGYTKKGGIDLGFVKLNAQWGYDKKSTVMIDVQKYSEICSSEQGEEINQARGIQARKLGT
ncbi:DNRLRE domain-containing protein [Nocardioides lijunqiniae]|uniref:DNRLRE domain-containing protein n=1 Tax=Nocardioides lijunqiniae TaxID=2760832 RepID=UPI001877C10C|nr:DNRLRE domain-containing protein [Nocardioides lijunqiniae]